MYFAWTILHAVVFLLWLVLFFLGARLVRKQYGIWFYVLMLAGLIGMIVGGGSQFRRGTSKTQLESEQIVLEDFSAFDLRLKTYFNRDSANRIFQVYEDVNMSGFLSGFAWETSRIDLKQAGNGSSELAYTVLGSLKWKLLGLTVYTEAKNYRGSLRIIQSNH